MSKRIKKVFSDKKKKLITFVTGGDPNTKTSQKILEVIVNNGSDIIEIGMPFSDPMADGPVIQRASERALKNKVGIKDTIKLAKSFRETNKKTPLILMGYANPIEAIGVDNFISLIKEAQIDGVITVDYPPEESREFVKRLNKEEIDSILLLSPTTEDERIKLIAKQASGFLYYVSLKGVTGAANIDIEQVSENVKNIQKYSDLPVAVGFGVRDPKTAKAVSKISDGVVIGSRIVKEIEESDKVEIISNVKKLMHSMKAAIDSSSA